ncbi:MAG: beta-ketoacyl synthase, partial [Anaerolineaceae bacterium]
PAPSAPAVSGVSLSALSEALLNIVSDKTGYPAEMLELEMDIEADLGIDSIKRVEILGAMRDEFPQLPDLPAEDLAELRTLQEIVDYMGDQMPSGSSNGKAEIASPKAPAPEKATNGGATPALTQLDHDIPRTPTALKPLPRPDFIAVDPPADGVCVLTDDGTPLTGMVAEGLSAKGWSVVVLSFPSDVVGRQSAIPSHVARVTLSDMAEVRIEEALKTISDGHGHIAAFVHISPSSHQLGANGDLFVSAEKALVKHAFLLAKHLKRPLNDAAERGYALFMTVARLDGAFGTRDGRYGAVSGGLFGLTKTVNLEWAGVFCRALDVSAGLDDATAAAQIIAEMHDPNRVLVDVGLSQSGRVTIVASAVV